MIVYSVTVSIDKAREGEWVAWMRTRHLPEVMATGCFTNYRFVRLLEEEPDNQDAVSYNTQYLLPSLAHYDTYKREFAPALQAESAALFGGSFASFRTLLELIEQGSYVDA